MDLFENSIRESITNHHFLDIYRLNLTDEPIFGVITQKSEYFACIRRFTTEGGYDGLSIIRTGDITNIGKGGKVRNKSEKLAKRTPDFRGELHLELDSIRNLVVSVDAKFGYLSLFMERLNQDDFYLGKVKEINESFLILDAYGPKENLKDRTELLFKLELITRIDVDGIYEKGVLQLI